MEKKRDYIFVIVVIIATIILYFIPNKFEKQIVEGVPLKAKVIEVNNDNVKYIGIVKTGSQGVKLKIVSGKYKGQIFETNVHFLGKMEFDRMYKVGDYVYCVGEVDSEKKLYHINVIDYYRLDSELILFLLYSVFIIVFARFIGVKALISFVFTVIMIWKVLLPSMLQGVNPVLITFFVTTVLTFVIIFLVGGFSRKGVVSFLGSMAGVISALIFSLVFGKWFNIIGAIKPFSENLLYMGYTHLDISLIFLSGIFLSSSGAMMDISMDIAASLNEIVEKRPDITMIELIKSGFSVGRAVVGTMATTLLLAYSGGYSTLLMIFIAQKINIFNILNLQYVAAEILNTIVGSFGLLLVAPFTAIIGGLVYRMELSKISFFQKKM